MHGRKQQRAVIRRPLLCDMTRVGGDKSDKESKTREEEEKTNFPCKHYVRKYQDSSRIPDLLISKVFLKVAPKNRMTIVRSVTNGLIWTAYVGRAQLSVRIFRHDILCSDVVNTKQYHVGNTAAINNENPHVIDMKVC